MAQPRVLIIYTGGTIGMVQDPESDTLQPFNFDHLTGQVPELKRLKLKLFGLAFDYPIDSSDASFDLWLELVDIIEEHYDQYDGFVILHGTDTMAYTASALSFMLEGLNKPVILTGSQLPIGVIRTDGKENLITAIEIAGQQWRGRPAVPEVAIYFEYMLYRGNRTFKGNSEQFEAFESPNYPILAKAAVDIQYRRGAICEADKENPPLVIHREMDRRVASLKLFPGISEKVVRVVTEIDDLQGLILETFGAGNAPQAPWFLDALTSAVERDMVIFNITQCRGGSVQQGRYANSATLEKIGVVGGGDIVYEAAMTKLMHLLGRDIGREEVKRLLATPLRGEMSLSNDTS